MTATVVALVRAATQGGDDIAVALMALRLRLREQGTPGPDTEGLVALYDRVLTTPQADLLKVRARVAEIEAARRQTPTAD